MLFFSNFLMPLYCHLIQLNMHKYVKVCQGKLMPRDSCFIGCFILWGWKLNLRSQAAKTCPQPLSYICCWLDLINIYALRTDFNHEILFRLCVCGTRMRKRGCSRRASLGQRLTRVHLCDFSDHCLWESSV